MSISKSDFLSRKQWSLSYQPKQSTILAEIPQNYHTFALFDPPKIGNLMTTEKSPGFLTFWGGEGLTA